jgi:hypothetical protein
MEDPLSELMPGRHIAAVLANGQQCRGMITGIRGGWLSLGGNDKTVLVNLAQTAAITLDAKPAPVPQFDMALPKPTSKEAPIRAVGKALGRAWLDEDLKALANAYLDGEEDSAIAQRISRARVQIKELRQAFECARGNVAEDQISPIAATWVPRWHKALRPG